MSASSLIRAETAAESVSGPRLDFSPERDVLGDGQGVDKHEVLVDHSDAFADGIGRRGDRYLLAVHRDLARIGPVQAVEDPHEGALAGAVLPEEGVDLAAAYVEVDVIVGDHPGEAFGYACHLEERNALQIEVLLGCRDGHHDRSFLLPSWTRLLGDRDVAEGDLAISFSASVLTVGGKVVLRVEGDLLAAVAEPDHVGRVRRAFRHGCR